jgi:parallel beta-helix repeat protein
VGNASTIYISPGTSIQSIVNANPPGTIFVLRPGVFRTQSIIPKNGDSFIGQSGAILNGSQLLTSFSQETLNGVTYWVAEGPSHPGLLNSRCDDNFPMCQYPENLYIDNEPLLRASSLSRVTTGTCYYDYSAAKIFFLSDPNGHTVETSSMPIAFQQGPNNITIQGLIIEKYATPGQRGASGGQYAGRDWIVKNNEIRLNHGEGVKVGNEGQVLNNYIHDNGQLGLAVNQTTTAVLVQNNEIARNNWAGFRISFEAGGAKFGYVVGLTAQGNYVHDNVGIGIWFDGGSRGIVVENNTIENNAKNGISYEVSQTGTIQSNVITGNGFGTSWEWMGGTGIQINESDHVVVADNFVAGNYRQIVMGMSPRTVHGGNTHPDLNNNFVHNNVIVTRGSEVNGITGLYQTMSNDAYYTSKNNTFENNTYCIPSSGRGYYWWMNRYQTTESWKATGQDVNGSWACPGVYVSSPSNGATVSSKVSVNAAAADTVSITKVVFYLDNALVATSTTTPYTYTWDTTKDTNGIHTVKAEAYNEAGQMAASSVAVTVQNP